MRAAGKHAEPVCSSTLWHAHATVLVHALPSAMVMHPSAHAAATMGGVKPWSIAIGEACQISCCRAVPGSCKQLAHAARPQRAAAQLHLPRRRPVYPAAHTPFQQSQGCVAAGGGRAWRQPLAIAAGCDCQAPALIAAAAMPSHPVRYVLLGAGLALALTRRRRRNTQSTAAAAINQHCHSKAAVHAYVASPPPSEPAGGTCDVAAASPASGASRAALLLLAVASLLTAAAAAASMQRQQWDVAGAVLTAWLLVLLAQVLGQRQRRRYADAEQLLEPDAAVEVVDGAPPYKPLPNFNGMWLKDGSASSSMEAAFRLVRLNGVMRTAARLIKGLDITCNEAVFSFGAFSVISWFKITERYTMDGEVCYSRRRDMRRGRARGRVRPTPQGTLLLEYAWDEPHAGTGVDEFSVDERGRLVMVSTVRVGGEEERYTQVYVRKA